MAILKVLNGKDKYHDDNAREDVISYILNRNKTPHSYYQGFMVDFTDIHGSMTKVAEKFGKTSGVKLRHFLIAFEENEKINAMKAYEIGKQIADYFIYEYQTVFAVHEDTKHPHIHIVINSISYVDGHRYYGKKREFNGFLYHIKDVLRRYRIPIYYVPNYDLYL